MIAAGPLSVEDAKLDRAIARRRMLADRARTADPAVAARISRLGDYYPWARPDVIWSLGKGGHDPGTPVADEIGRRSAIERSRTGFARPGQTVPVARLKGLDAPADDIYLGRAAGFGRRPYSSRGAVAAMTAHDEASDRLARLAAAYPGADRAVLWDAALAGAEPGTPAAERAASGAGIEMPAAQNISGANLPPALQRPDRVTPESDEPVTYRQGSKLIGQGTEAGVFDVASDPGSVLQPVARTAGMVANAFLQEPVGLFRNVYSDLNRLASGDTSWSGGWAKYNEFQSDLGIAGERLVKGEDVDVGSGYFVDPESDVAQERLRRERERGLIYGHAITPGRAVAQLLPGGDNLAFDVASGLVDFGIALKADPTAMIANKIGAYRGLRNVVDPAKADAWLTAGGRGVVDAIAAETSFEKLRQAFDKKVPVDIVLRLTDARTSDEVTDILRETLGTRLREFPELQRVRRGVTGKGYVRLAGAMPSSRIDLDDTDDAVEQIDRVLRNAKIPADRIGEYTERMARAAGNRHAQYQVVTDAMDEIQAQALASGIKPAKAESLATLFVESHDNGRRFFVNQIGENVDHPGALVGGDGVVNPSPHLYDEVLNRYVEMPDARTMRRNLSPWRVPLTNPLIEKPEAFLHFLVNRVWRDSVLLRLAYPIRVIGEEQFRMAAAGLDSAFRHPMSYVSYVVGRKGGADVFENAWEDVEAFRRAMTRGSAGFRDPTGWHRSNHWTIYRPGEDHYVASWADELSQLAADPIAQKVVTTDDLDDVKEWFWSGPGAHLRNDLLRSPDFDAIRARGGADEYIDSILERIHVKTAGDSRLIDALKTGRLNGAKVSHDGATLSRDFVKQLQGVFDEGIDAGRVKGQIRVQAKSKGAWVEHYDEAMERMFGFLMGRRTNELSRSPTFEQRYWQRMEELSPYLSADAQSRAAARAEELNLGKRARGIAGATPRPEADLMDVPAPFRKSKTRLLADEDRDWGPAAHREIYEQWEFNDHVYELVRDQRGGGPEWSLTRIDREGRRLPNGNMADRGRVQAEAAFDVTQRGIEVHKVQVDPQFQQQGFNKELTAVLEDLASGEGLDLHRTAVVNPIQRGHLERAGYARLPDDFRPAAFDRYSDVEGPNYVKRFGGGVRSPSEPITLEQADELAKGFALDQTKHLLYDLAERGQFFDVMRLIFPFGEAWKEMVGRWSELITTRPQSLRRLQQGIEQGKDSGVFYTDPQTKDLVFTYPGSAWLNEHTPGIGVPVPLTGRVQGLSLMTEVMPGVGPVVQIPASYLIPDTPDWDWLTNQVLPFGRVRNPTELRNWAPPFIQKFLTALAPTADMQRSYANSVKDMSNYLISTGKYQVHGPDAEDEIDRLMRDSKRKAKALYFIRGFAQSFSPSAPTPAAIVEDKDGNVQLLATITEDYYKMVAADPDNATEKFLNKYGDNLFAAMQSKSYPVIFGVPMTKKGLDWVRSNPAVAKKYPFTYGYFAPVGDPDDFSFDAYRRAFESGAKAAITPEQWIGLAQHRVGAFLYRKAKDKVGDRPTDSQRALLAELKDALKDEFPGYERPLGLPARAETGQLIDELSRAVENPTIAKTEAGEALKVYLSARGKAEDAALASGYQRSSFATAKGMRDTRDWLRGIGSALVEARPAFSELWDGVLERELNDDTEEEAAA